MKRLKDSYMYTISVSKGLYPDQDQHFVGSDLGSNCLPRLSTDGTVLCLTLNVPI